MSMTRRAPDDGATAVRRRHRGTSPFGRTRGLAVAAAVLIAASACGGGSSKPAPSSTTTTTTPPATSSPTTGQTTTPPATSSANGPSDPTGATAEIKKNWELFFNPQTTIADKEKYLQHGSTLAPLLQGFATDPRVGQVSATVSGVSFTSPTTATVTYSLSLQGTVVEPNATGTAVLEDGTWKVSDSTLCGLVALTGNPNVPGCS
ncbi:hypothetical protein ABH926_003135 [Catenulispora sp. GP43]|uniref:hypothetical protein n=1 Tax=Catenulispora sp. GP43 TaxID=3156263 RepID=UPI003513F5C8